MPKATRCLHDGRECGVAEALRLRDAARRQRQDPPTFTCVDCGEPVRPHKEGRNGQAAHFEHHDRNKGCDLSHRMPGT